jgi:hypothetical protein
LLRALTALALWLALPSMPAAQPAEVPASPTPDERPWRARVVPLPAIAYQPETSLQLGVFGYATWRRPTMPELAPSNNYGGNVLYTLRRQLIFESSGLIILPHWRWEIDNNTVVRDFPDNYYGIGNRNQGADVEVYDKLEVILENDIRRRFHPQMYVAILQRLAWRRSEGRTQDSALDAESPVGLGDDLAIGLGGAFAWDTRDHKIDTFRGAFIETQVIPTPGFVGSDNPFVRYRLDARGFFRISRSQRVGIQGVGLFHTGRPGFLNLALMGGGDLMRGVYLGRYRDRQYLAAQSEWRWTFHRLFGVVAFVSAGAVGDRPLDLADGPVHVAFGGGLRWLFAAEDRVSMRFDLGLVPRGPHDPGQGLESVGFYINMGEAF